MCAWRGQEQHMILFVTSGGFYTELTILAYLKEDVANGSAVRDPVSLYLQNQYYSSYYYYKERLRRPRSGIEVKLYSFFNLGARWGCVVNVTPRPIYPRERPGTHCIGGCVGPRAGLGGNGKSHPHRDSIPGPSSP
jgi:hypothetical protein